MYQIYFFPFTNIETIDDVFVTLNVDILNQIKVFITLKLMRIYMYFIVDCNYLKNRKLSFFILGKKFEKV